MKRYLACLAALLILAGLSGCKSQSRTAPALLEPVGVKMDTAKAEIGEIYKISTYSGEVVPYVEELHFLVDGRVEEMKVTLGDTVQEGEILATLDEDQIRGQIEALESEIADTVKLGEFSDRLARADIGIAKEELAMLREAGASAESIEVKELDIQKLQESLSQSQEIRNLELGEKKRSLENLRQKAGNNQITAPFSGRIVYISQVGKGDAIQGYIPVFYIADDSRLSLTSDYIPESVVTSADKVYAKIMDKEYEITYVPYEMSEYVTMALSGEEMKTQFSIGGVTDGLESGLFAAIMVQSSYRDNVLTIPANALYRDEGGRYVYKMVEDQRVRCDVTVGMVTDTKAEITEGLQEGDVVYVKE